MADERRVSTGIAGLDEVLHGGLLRGRTYLISGPPGSGKTTFLWHFLSAGVAVGEPVLLVSFGESESSLQANARLSGFDPTDVHILDLSPSSELFAQGETYDIFSPAEVERRPITQRITAAIKEIQPLRLCIDSISHLRYLSNDPLEFRRQALSFLKYLTDRGIDSVITSETTPDLPDNDLRFLSDGVIELDSQPRSRMLLVTKFRGSGYRQGCHAMRLDSRGVTVFPRLIPERHGKEYDTTQLSTGLPDLDNLLHGGIERGTINMITGPSGVGKSTLGTQIMKEAAVRGERSILYTFDERPETLIQRSTSLRIPLQKMIDAGTLQVVEVEALRFGADEFADMVRTDVDEHGTSMVMIDSISGYQLSVSGGELSERLHALCKYLQNVGVTVLLVNEVNDLDNFRISDIGISYLADTVVYLRYIERRHGDFAELGKAIGVLKKRLSDFDKTLREFDITSDGVTIGRPTSHLRGVFGGLPYVLSPSDTAAHDPTS